MKMDNQFYSCRNEIFIDYNVFCLADFEKLISYTSENTVVGLNIDIYVNFIPHDMVTAFVRALDVRSKCSCRSIKLTNHGKPSESINDFATRVLNDTFVIVLEKISIKNIALGRLNADLLISFEMSFEDNAYNIRRLLENMVPVYCESMKFKNIALSDYDAGLFILCTRNAYDVSVDGLYTNPKSFLRILNGLCFNDTTGVIDLAWDNHSLKEPKAYVFDYNNPKSMAELLRMPIVLDKVRSLRLDFGDANIEKIDGFNLWNITSKTTSYMKLRAERFTVSSPDKIKRLSCILKA